MHMLLAWFNACVGALLGFFVGRFIALSAHLLPEILLEERGEPRDIFTAFFSAKRYKVCKAKAPKKFFWLPILYATLIGATLLVYPLSLSVVFVLFASSLLILSFVTDYENRILPDQLTLTLLWTGLLASIFNLFITPEEAILGAIFGYVFFYITNLIYRMSRGVDGMYPGDFKLNAAIGAFAGFSWLVWIILLSFFLLVVFSLIAHFAKKDKKGKKLLKTEMPYGCFASLITIIFLYAIWL